MAQDLAQGRDLHLQVVLLDHEAGPHRGEELVLGEEAIEVVDQRDEDIEGPCAQGDRNAIGEQRPLVRTQLEAPEAPNGRNWGQGRSVTHAGLVLG